MLRYSLAAAAALLASAAPAHALVQWTVASGGNGHYYEYYSGVPLSFEQALVHAAAATPIAGYTPHMATVTSAAESAFIYDSFNGPNWGAQGFIAGSDTAVEGEWRWMAGPEAGQLFWSGDAGGSSPSYANWQATHPHNFSGTEDYAYAYQQGSTFWASTAPIVASNYILEYSPNSEFAVGGVPEPATWAMMLLGFLVLGSAARKRRVRATA
jgi:hypothetical protein